MTSSDQVTPPEVLAAPTPTLFAIELFDQTVKR
jgi:hypothetical protein